MNDKSAARSLKGPGDRQWSVPAGLRGPCFLDYSPQVNLYYRGPPLPLDVWGYEFERMSWRVLKSRALLEERTFLLLFSV